MDKKAEDTLENRIKVLEKRLADLEKKIKDDDEYIHKRIDWLGGGR